MVLSRETQVFRRDAQSQGKLFTAEEREKLLKPYLPSPSSFRASSTSSRAQPIRTFVRTQIHTLVFIVIHTIFSIYIRLRQAYHAIISRTFAILYYHHRTPELIRKDVRGLRRLPEHLSVVLELRVEEKGAAGLEILLDELAELSAWCASVGLPILSVYERTGTNLPWKGGLSKDTRLTLSSYRNPKKIHTCNAPCNIFEAACIFRPATTFPPNPSATFAIFSKW